MSVPESKIIAAINHYQNGIRKHEKNKDKLLYYLTKLAKFPMTVSILQKTLVGLQINALRKYEGDVGNAAKVLVTKWKDVVRQESEGAHSDEEMEEDEDEVANHNHHSDDSGVDNNELEDAGRDDSPEISDEETENHSINKSKKELTNGHSKKSEKQSREDEKRHSSSRSKNDDKHRSNHESSSSKKSSHESKSSSSKSRHESSSKKSHDSSNKNSRDSSSKKSEHESRKRKKHEISESESESSQNDSDSSDESTRSNKRQRVIKSEKRDSSDERDSDSDSGSYTSDSTDRKRHSHRKHEKSRKSSHSHHSSSSSKKDSSHKKSDDNKKSSRDESKSSHSSSKTSHIKSERHKDKEEDKSSSKDKHSKSSDHHKSKSSKTDVKIKVEKDDSKSSKSGKESQKSQSPVKVKQEKEKEKVSAVNSFEAALMGLAPPPEPATKVKTKSKPSSKPSTSSSDKKSSHSSESKASKSPATSPGEHDLFPEVKADLDIASSLPELADVYRPLPHSSEKKDRPKLMSEDEALTSIMTTKNQRTKVYSGNKAFYTKVPSLFELCTRVLIENIDLLEYTGGVPYDILKPVIERATPDQLFLLEFHNEYLKEDTDAHWEFHCQRDFRNKTKGEDETWRDLYVRCMDERQQKLERLTNNISRNIAESAPARKTKLAYVDSAVKPPRNIMRKQAKHGTGSSSTPSSSKHEIIAKSVKGESSSSKASEAPVKVTSPSMQRATTYVNNLIKKKKAPLMAKTLQFMKGNRFKR